MDVVSFRLPKKMKEDMKKVDINWSEEIRKFIERTVRAYKKGQSIKKIDSLLKILPEANKGTASKYVREDRDGN
ncbi:MAG TPA: hypothetical protein ENI33_08585 [Thermoplasmatales archaeon]|nr:hypothetical protein [Thermoplasmatales archaeon]